MFSTEGAPANLEMNEVLEEAAAKLGATSANDMDSLKEVCSRIAITNE
jgi:hypothetical protein